MVGRFKLLHPEVYNIDDAGFLMGGKCGREILFWGFNICTTTTPRPISSYTVETNPRAA